LFDVLSGLVLEGELLLRSADKLLFDVDHEHVAFRSVLEAKHHSEQALNAFDDPEFVLHEDAFGHLLELLLDNFELRFNGCLEDASEPRAQVMERGQVHPGALVLRIDCLGLAGAYLVQHLADKGHKLVNLVQALFFGLDVRCSLRVERLPVLS